MGNIIKLMLNEYCSNTYCLKEDDGSVTIIDPGYFGGGSNKLVVYLKKHYSKVNAILLTHGHIDHIASIQDIYDEFGIVPIYLSKFEEGFLTNENHNLAKHFGIRCKIINPETILLDDNEKFSIGTYDFIFIHTPFHTVGSGCFYLPKEKALFSGDTLFKRGIGRSDLPTGDESLINSSLAKLRKLPLDTKVYAGHGEDTTLENEINRYL